MQPLSIARRLKYLAAKAIKWLYVLYIRSARSFYEKALAAGWVF